LSRPLRFCFLSFRLSPQSDPFILYDSFLSLFSRTEAILGRLPAKDRCISITCDTVCGLDYLSSFERLSSFSLNPLNFGYSFFDYEGDSSCGDSVPLSPSRFSCGYLALSKLFKSAPRFSTYTLGHLFSLVSTSQQIFLVFRSIFPLIQYEFHDIKVVWYASRPNNACEFLLSR